MKVRKDGELEVQPIEGDMAHNEVDSGNPLKIGGKGVNTTPTAVANGDRVDAFFDLRGFQHTRIQGDQIEGTAVTATQPVLIAGDGGTNIKNMAVDATTGDVQVDVTNTVTVSDDGSFTTEVTQATAANLNCTEANSGAIASSVATVASNTTGLSGTVGVDGVAGPAFALSVAGTESGGTMQELRVDADGHLQVDALSLPDVTQSTASSLNAQVVGNVAHDAADSGNPVKVGAYAHDYEPDTDGEIGRTAVAEADRADVVTNLKGEVVTAVNARYHEWSNVSTTYNDTTTTATSAAIECWQYRVACISFELTESGAATDILFEVFTSYDGTNFTKMRNGPLGLWLYDDSTIADSDWEDPNLVFPIACHSIQLKVTATGTDSSNTFTVTNAAIYLRT